MLLTLGLYCWSKCLSQFDPLSDQKAYWFTIKGHCPEEKKWRRVIKHESKLTPCVKGAEVVLLTPVFNWLSKEKALKDEDSSFFFFFAKASLTQARNRNCASFASARIRRAGAPRRNTPRALCLRVRSWGYVQNSLGAFAKSARAMHKRGRCTIKRRTLYYARSTMKWVSVLCYCYTTHGRNTQV